MRVSHISVILSKAKDLVFSATYEDEIFRLRLRMTVATLSHYAGEERGGGPKRLNCLNILNDWNCIYVMLSSRLMLPDMISRRSSILSFRCRCACLTIFSISQSIGLNG